MTTTELHILDWYDDILTSLVSSEKDTYIFNCIQKNFVSGEKIYYCIKIDEDSCKQIRSIIKKGNFTDKDWNIMSQTFEKNNKNNHVFLSKTKSLAVGSEIVLNKVNSSDIIQLKFPSDISVLYTGIGYQ
ncbi:hypothetical protein [Chryseobacterium sp.]|uniref:hypothetical protein n=1 Tax=Chryseobacterium sp. TaxID=1871047 RepID=UPI001B2CDF93|nr:hypothetical protein [Chryseobacterium sp.]MBO9693767.1 hypothetical protein [Chryseobacterium sp.]